MKNIFIDTDIGGDVDDALAVALALNSGELTVKGISLVYKGNEWRSGVMQNMLEVFGRTDIPVALGAEKPLMGYWDEFIPEADNRAAECIIQACDADPELILVPIGPLTNIAAAFIAAPRIAKNRKVMLMGGTYNQARAEWNIICDPLAAALVYSSGADISMVGLNVTEQCQFTQAEVDAFAEGPPKAKYLHGMMLEFTRNFGYLPILHDPLAVGALIWPDIITFEEKKMAVETGGAHTRAVTIETHAGAKMQVATAVNASLFKTRLLERILQ